MVFRRVGFYIAYGRSLRRSNLSPPLVSSHEFHLSPDLDSSCNYPGFPFLSPTTGNASGPIARDSSGAALEGQFNFAHLK
jgi:hypothetical protein